MDKKINEYITMKLLCLGDSSTGKTSIILRHVEHDFNTSYVSTIGIDFKLKTYKHKHENKIYNFKQQIWDTAGQEKFKSLHPTYFKNSHGIIIVFDITNRDSFNHVSSWISDIVEKYCKDSSKVKIILIGNKTDLIDSSKDYVSNEEAEKLAKEYKIEYIPTSAYNGHNVDIAFNRLSELVAENLIKNDNNSDQNLISLNTKNISTNKKSCCS